MTEPEEKQPEPKQTTTKDAIEIMLKAIELAEMSTGYKTEEKVTLIYFDDGRRSAQDSTLSAYIKKAEQVFIKKHAFAIIKDAKELLESEIGEIREMLQ